MSTTVSVSKTTPLQDALKKATAVWNQSGDEVNASLLASGGIQQALQRALQASDPTLGQLRTEKTAADTRLGSVFANSIDDLKDVTDPTMREAIRGRRSAQYGAESAGIGGRISDLGASQDKTIGSLTNIFNATTTAKQTEAQRKRQAMEDLLDEKKTLDQRGFESRFDDLTRREKEASIAASNRSNRGWSGSGSALTLADQVKNPLLAFLAGGGKRTASPDGGFNYFDPSGKPITVEEAAAMVPGGTKADLLSGSANTTDQNTMQDASGKPLSAAALQQKTNRESGTQSLAKLEDLLNTKKISNKDMLTSKSGLTSLFASSNAKQYRDAARNVADMVARIRTGAQINEKEMELYLQFVPGPSDDAATRAQKIATLKTIFGNASQAAAPDSTSTDTSAFPGYSPS